MFAVIQKGKKQMAVHSVGDLRYMLANGWQVKPEVKPEVKAEPVAEIKAPTKRKYVRRNHGR